MVWPIARIRLTAASFLKLYSSSAAESQVSTIQRTQRAKQAAKVGSSSVVPDRWAITLLQRTLGRSGCNVRKESSRGFHIWIDKVGREYVSVVEILFLQRMLSVGVQTRIVNDEYFFDTGTRAPFSSNSSQSLSNAQRSLS